MARPLTDLTDTELADALREKAANVVYSYNGIVEEMERRSRDRESQATRRTATYALWISVAGVVVSAIAAVLGFMRT